MNRSHNSQNVSTSSELKKLTNYCKKKPLNPEILNLAVYYFIKPTYMSI